MILYKSRSAKSVACRRLNVIGVSAFFFLPVLVAAFTRADEFHSVTNTRCPSALSHFASSPSCVVFPEPSMPSTTNSLPGYSWGSSRLFTISALTDFNAQWLAEDTLEWRRVSSGSPKLELRVAGGSQLQQSIFAPVVQFDAGHRLGVAAIEALGQPENGRERPDRSPAFAGEIGITFMAALGCGAPMISGEKRHDFDLLRLEPAEIAVLDEIVGMLMVALVADVNTDIVEDRPVLEPFALAIGQSMDAACVIEQCSGEPRDLLRVFGPVVAPLGELDDAAPPDVGI